MVIRRKFNINKIHTKKFEYNNKILLIKIKFKWYITYIKIKWNIRYYIRFIKTLKLLCLYESIKNNKIIFTNKKIIYI